MVGKGVVEVGLLSSFLGFWLAYLVVPDSAEVYWVTPLLDERSYYVLVAAVASIFSAICFSISRKESDVVEVFGRGGLLVFGGGIALLFYASPFIIYGGYMPRGDGVTLRLIMSGIDSNFFLSMIVALPFSLGSLSLYLFCQGVKGFIVK